MNHLKRHFLVVNLSPPDAEPQKDADPVISIDLTDTRHSFLGRCQGCHWQFNTPRHAQFSTMMILHHIHNKPSYCLEDCKHNRVEDGSFMVGCEMCDNWYHGDCVGVSKARAPPARPSRPHPNAPRPALRSAHARRTAASAAQEEAADLDSYTCPKCLENAMACG